MNTRRNINQLTGTTTPSIMHEDSQITSTRRGRTKQKKRQMNTTKTQCIRTRNIKPTYWNETAIDNARRLAKHIYEERQIQPRGAIFQRRRVAHDCIGDGGVILLNAS
jgi:hypothetical protein